MTKPSSAIADALLARARGLNQFAQRMERAFDEGHIPLHDLHRTYAAAYIRFMTSLERSIEQLFIGLLRGRYVPASGRVRPLVTCNSDVVAHRIIRGDRSYVDWIPFRYTEKRARAFFSQGGPFCRLSRSEKKIFDKVALVRHAIAHESHHALRQFRTNVIGTLPIPPSQQRPEPYLRGRHALNQTRLEHWMSEGVRVFSVVAT